jgi:putative transposase
LTNDQFILNGSRIRIPNLGWVRMREPLRFEGKVQSATISRKADRWFISFNVKLDNLSHLPKAENQGETGVDCWSDDPRNALDRGEGRRT